MRGESVELVLLLLASPLGSEEAGVVFFFLAARVRMSRERSRKGSMAVVVLWQEEQVTVLESWPKKVRWMMQGHEEAEASRAAGESAEVLVRWRELRMNCMYS